MNDNHTSGDQVAKARWEDLMVETDFDTRSDHSLYVLARYDFEQSGASCE